MFLVGIIALLLSYSLSPIFLFYIVGCVFAQVVAATEFVNVVQKVPVLTTISESIPYETLGTI